MTGSNKYINEKVGFYEWREAYIKVGFYECVAGVGFYDACIYKWEVINNDVK